MGSIHVADMHDQSPRENGCVNGITKEENGDVGCRTFEVDGLASDKNTTPTGMREETLLLAWLIVLLRTREGQVGFDWAYRSQANGIEREPANTNLSMEKVMSGLQDSLPKITSAISSHITTEASSHVVADSNPASLLISTSSLSQTSEEAKDEGVLHLEVRYDQGLLEVRPLWHSDNMLEHTVTRYVETLVDMVKFCLSNPDASIEESFRPTARDLDEIWGYNHELPPFYDFCMHEMISDRAKQFPDKVAIDSWDGRLTYGQIDQYSTAVAHSLKDMGVELHDIVPCCFEKSRWAIVAVLAVMKTGATFALMDPTLPLARLQNIAEQVGAKAMVSSRQQHELSTSIVPGGKFFVVEEEAFVSIPEDLEKLPTVPTSALMYIIFTSGSTGTPKGVKVSHGSYTSSAIPRAAAVGYNEESRVLDFASYAFDVSIDSMLLTTGNGGCLCIPSDEDRLNDINGVIRNMQINYAGVTPSVARILDDDVISSLSALGLGGEAASARDVNIWGQTTRIIIGYGPCECTIGCTINSDTATGRDYISIGTGNGAAIWITNPNDHESLVPLGAVGELLVEGPIVGQGYLNDPEKTASVFIEDPAWLVAGHGGRAGRRGRLYKTGDLGKYDPDGSGGIIFAGRKDTQVKLRGQRVELGEIESQLRARLPSDTNVIVEVITPLGTGGQPTLVAFVSFQSTKGQPQAEISSVQLSDELNNTLSSVNADIAKVLPRYMVPTAYIPVNNIPVLISGKTDRKQLRSFGATVDLRQLDQGAAQPTRELTDLEKRLRQAWSQTLSLDAEGIRLEDNFFALGGDSLAAMRLSTVCRLQGLDLSVISTFNNPTLSAMAEVVKICDVEVQKEIPAFSTISRSVESACLEASSACGTDQAAVEDIYPCTPTQESLFTFSLKSTKVYVAQRVAAIPSNVSLDAWKQAWEDVVAAYPILRTRLAQLQEPGLQQVVLREGITWRHSNDLTQYLETDREERMDLGQSLARYAIVDSVEDNKQYMVWTIHHVCYDGWSEPLVLKQIGDALQGQDIQPEALMRDFVEYVRETDEDAMQEFWQKELKGAVGPQFPRLPSRDFLPTPTGMVERSIPLETSAGSPFTLATLIRGAWALVSSQYAGSDDVVFGETLMGRDIPLPGVEGIVGPLIATVPVRIHVHRTATVESFLQSVQQGTLARTPWQHMGMQNIRKVSQDAQHACEAPTGLVIQPEPEYDGNDLGFLQGDVVHEALHFNPYPLMLACGIRKGGFRIAASFDSGLIEVPQMERILTHFEMACLQLQKGLDRRINEITCLPEAELSQIWRWNQIAPLSLDESSRRLRADASIKQGSRYPPAVVPWVCDLRNPSLLAPIGCVGELWLEGDFLSGETIDTPAWLEAGSSACPGRTGKVQPTGDMVQMQPDGSLVFIGRRDNVLTIQGHAVDLADVEAHFSERLPAAVRAAAAVSKPSPDSEQELVFFIERPSSMENNVEILLEKHNITTENFETSISTSVPVDLAVALKRLDKFVHDSLPSYMAPSTYIVVENIPIEKGQINHSSLNQLASSIPQDVLTQIRAGLTEAWTKSSTQTSLTVSEDILRSSWAKLLRVSPEQIDVDDNFFRLGGDSVLAMKLVSSLRAQGHSLSVADIFQHMRLGDAAKVLKVNRMSQVKVQAYKPFSTLGDVDLKSFLSEIVRPQLADSAWSITDVAPVTDTQVIDIKDTVNSPRTSVQYTMLYFKKGIDREELFRACKEVTKAHDILRTVFIEHESRFYQVVVDGLDIPVNTHQTDSDIEQSVLDLCKTDIESDFQLGSPFFKLLHVESNDGQECLVIRLSHSQYDGTSLPRLLRDLEGSYRKEAITDFKPFTSYISDIREQDTETKAIDYWRNLLKDSSLSVIAGSSVQPGDKSIFQEKTVDTPQRLEEFTTANLLTAAWAVVLARRLQKTDVTFGSVTSGRTGDLPDVENVVGPCYQFTPVRVPFNTQWTSLDLLRFVQQQAAQSAAFDYLGFEKISSQCADWSETPFFDSIVHHQDAEDFDEMPFAGGSCRVEIANPHGDAAYPFKAVTYVKGGQMHVGVVGSERDTGFVDAVLEELAAVVHELATRPEEKVLLAN